MLFIRDMVLDVNAEQQYKTINAKRSDSLGRILRIKLQADGIDVSIPSGATVTLRCQRPDGVCHNNIAQFSGSTILATLTPDSISKVGLDVCDILITEGDTTLSTYQFYINVLEAPVGT